MGAIILDGARIGAQSIVGAGALVTQGFQAPPGSLVIGAPARIVRMLSRKERSAVKHWAAKYVQNAAYCLKHGIGLAGDRDGKSGV
jgi:carbonic anhydrase/acetyltransferase-like protein (isoleucine patch superfamily)